MLPSRTNAFQGLLFLIGSAACSPGASAAATQVVRGGASNGRIVVAALSKPLAFEGARKGRAAEDLVAAVRAEGGADAVAVVDQDVLMGLPGAQSLTVESAGDICDAALEQVVRSVLQAASAPEVLKVRREGRSGAGGGIGER